MYSKTDLRFDDLPQWALSDNAIRALYYSFDSNMSNLTFPDANGTFDIQNTSLYVSALSNWDRLTNDIAFIESDNNPDIVLFKTDFNASNLGGQTSLFHPNLIIEDAEIAINQNIAEVSTFESYQTAIHEIGHALGLDHPGGSPYDSNYNTNITQMSYNIPNGRYAFTPMALDILTIEGMYGDIIYNPLDTDYNYLPNATGSINFDEFTGAKRAQTIVDTDGVDKFDVSAYAAGDVTIDLRQSMDSEGNWFGHYSEIGEEHVYIAHNTIIENAVGGAGNDTIVGNGFNNILEGKAGRDEIYGMEGDDILIGGAGDDVLDGGLGFDTADYSSSAESIDINVSTSTSFVTNNLGEQDFLNSIEQYVGTIHDDNYYINGVDASQAFWVDGGSGIDTVYLSSAGTFVVNPLFALRGETGCELSNIENIYSSGSTRLVVDVMGNDFGDGSVNYKELSLSYHTQSEGITADLLLGNVYNSTGTDFIDNNSYLKLSIEGTKHNDIFIGNSFGTQTRFDTISAGLGNDVSTIKGATTYIYTGGNDVINGNFNQLTITTPLFTNTKDITVNLVSVGLGEYNFVINFGAVGSITFADSNVFYANGEYDLSSMGGVQIYNYYVDNGLAYIDRYTNFDNETPSNTSFSPVAFSSIQTLGSSVSNQGDNIILSNVSDNTVNSLSGNDNVTGNNNNNQIYLDLGDDTAHGGGGNDSIYGGFGNDILDGGAGYDSVFGGVGDDVFSYRLSENIGNGDEYFAGLGTDTLKVYLTSAQFTANAQLEIDRYAQYLVDNANANTTGSTVTASFGLVLSDFEILEVYVDGTLYDAGNVIFGDENQASISGTSQIDTIYGSSGDDVIYASMASDYIDGRSGYDLVSYVSATSAVNVDLSQNIASDSGSSDIDTLINIEDVVGSAFNDDIIGDDTSNYLYGSGGDDTVYGGAGNDRVYGDSDDDMLYGEDGNDRLIGGAGNDILDGGSGIDTADYSSATSGVTVSIHSGTASDGEGGTDSLTGIENIIGSDYNDTLIGNNALDNTIWAGAGHDHVQGRAGGDILYGDAGNDDLRGANGDDLLYGGEGNDLLYGSNDNDTLFGGLGLDALWGQSGADVFVFETASAFLQRDNVKDFSLVDGDRIDLSDLLGAYDPLNDLITDFVQITDNGVHSYVAVDTDGGADNFQQVAQLSSVTGLTDEATLEANGTIIV